MGHVDHPHEAEGDRQAERADEQDAAGADAAEQRAEEIDGRAVQVDGLQGGSGRGNGGTIALTGSWGLTQELASRRARNGEWQRVFQGVFVLQSGPSSWRQQARAALLYAGRDATLSHRSAAFVRDVLPTPGPDIHITVPHARTVSRQPGLVVHRARHMPWAGGALRAVDEEEAVLGLVSGAATEDELVGLVCDAVRRGARPDV